MVNPTLDNSKWKFGELKNSSPQKSNIISGFFAKNEHQAPFFASHRPFPQKSPITGTIFCGKWPFFASHVSLPPCSTLWWIWFWRSPNFGELQMVIHHQLLDSPRKRTLELAFENSYWPSVVVWQFVGCKKSQISALQFFYRVKFSSELTCAKFWNPSVDFWQLVGEPGRWIKKILKSQRAADFTK